MSFIALHHSVYTPQSRHNIETMNSSQTFPHGSAPWLVTEQGVVNQFMIEEVENFSFKVRNQMDWLNGHMEEIFAPGNVYVGRV